MTVSHQPCSNGPMTTTDRLQPIPNTFQAPADVRETNSRKYARSSQATEQCFLCGRPLTDASVLRGAWIHLLTDNTLAPWGDSFYFADSDHDGVAGSQGAFPVGSECAKSIPKAYKGKGI